MPTLDGRALPPAYLRCLEDTLQRIPDAEMLAYAAGFLPMEFTKASAVRAHVAGQLKGDAEIPLPLLSLMQLYARGRLFVEALDNVQLSRAYLDFAMILGHEATALALLLDSRVSVRVLGESLFLAPAGPPVRSLDREICEERILDWMQRWVDDLGIKSTREGWARSAPEYPVEGTGAGANDPTRVAKLERILEDQKRRHREEAKQLKEELDRERKERAEERGRMEAEVRQLRENLVRVQATLESERGAREAVVRTVIEEEKRSLLRSWLASAEALEKAVRAPSAHEDLLARAETLVEAQASADRHTGNRRVLLERLEALERARTKLVEVARDSLQPLPAVGAHRERLSEEIARLEAVLGRSSGRSPVTVELCSRIESASTVEQAWSVRPLLDVLEEQRLLPPGELSQLERALVRRLGVFAETRPVDAPPSADQSWSLRAALQGKVSVRILIDGHNVTLGLPDYFGPATAGPEAERKAREKLLNAVSLLGERYPQVDVELHLDGARGGVQSPRSNVRVEFSGGVGSQRADAVMLGRLHHLALAESGRLCFLVTDDRRLREDAQREGARFVRSRPFAVLLEDTGCLGRQPVLEVRTATKG